MIKCYRNKVPFMLQLQLSGINSYELKRIRISRNVQLLKLDKLKVKVIFFDSFKIFSLPFKPDTAVRCS